MNTLDQRLDRALDFARCRFIENNPKSRQHNQMAAAFLPGGNTRTVIFTSPFPLTIARGEAAYLWDIDGHQYADLLGEYTAGLFGHSHPVIREAVIRGLDRGLVLSGHNTDEAELARLLSERFSSIELVRFTNSGTEANLMAIAAATVFTGRSKIVVFDGGYHGSVLNYPLGTKGKSNVPFDVLILPYNDIEALSNLFARESDGIAAILVEPMMGSAGCIPSSVDFLQATRSLSEQHGALLIFDEVQTSRLAPGGLQELYGITPDLTTLGKYLAGGVSFGAFGGNAKVMSLFNPHRTDALGHAGTFNNNSLSMSCGIAVLQRLFDETTCLALNDKGDRLRLRLNDLFRNRQVPMHVSGIGSIMNVHFARMPATNASDVTRTNPKLRELLWLEMVNSGFWIASRGMISLSLAVDDSHIDALCEAFMGFLSEYSDLIDESAS